MTNLKYQHILRAVLCATALVTIEPLAAKSELYQEEECHHIQGGKLNLPSIKNDEVAEDLEGHVEEQKYNLTGIALFSGKDVPSSVIKRLTMSHVSHVGIILSDADDENEWYCFESTGSESEVIKGQYPHVRITPWDTLASDYSTQNYLSTLAC